MLYDIIKSLQAAKGSLAKQSILDAHKANEDLKAYMKHVYDPAINYYQTKIEQVSGGQCPVELSLTASLIERSLPRLYNRLITGYDAKKFLADMHFVLDNEGKELLELLIKRSIGAGVGETMVLKTWPGLFFVPYYQRCSLMDDKIKAKFEAMADFVLQPKLDGSFAYLKVPVDGSPQIITRAGNTYPLWLAERLAKGLGRGLVFVGELEVFNLLDNKKPLERKEGNGILNSVAQGSNEENFKDLEFKLTCWDMLTTPEFKQGYSDRPYHERLSSLCGDANDGNTNVSPIETICVSSMKEAYAYYTKLLQEGKEGAVIKNLDGLWKNGTSKDCVKLKIAFEADYIITGKFEGEGKYKGMLGGITVQSSDGLLEANVGSGFTDAQRNLDQELVGKIVTVKANDIVTSKSTDHASLFLPIFVEVRYDKTQADTFEHVKAQLEAARYGA